MHIGYETPDKISGEDLSVLIVVTPDHPNLVDLLIEGTKKEFQKHGGDLNKITVISVPKREVLLNKVREYSESRKYDLILTLGILLRDEVLDPDSYVNREALSIVDISIQTGVIITNGMICATDLNEAQERVGGVSGHKGKEALVAALECKNSIKNILKFKAQSDSTYKVAIVAARWHKQYVDLIIDSVKNEILNSDKNKRVEFYVVQGAGSLELPFLAYEAIKTHFFNHIVCCGVVITGKTNHADVLNYTISNEIDKLSKTYSLPVDNRTILASSYIEVLDKIKS